MVKANGHRPKQRKNGNWSDRQLQKVLVIVDNGWSVHVERSETYQIPYSSFRDWCYGMPKSTARGSKGVLIVEEEEQLGIYLVKMCDMDYGLTPIAVKMKVVYEIMKTRCTPFNNVIPGAGWTRRWKLWHPGFTIRSSQGLDFATARVLSVENVKTLFYNNLASLSLSMTCISTCMPPCFWNYDKSCAQAGKMIQPIPLNENATQSVLKMLSLLICVK